MKLFPLLAAAALLSSCSSGVVQAGPNTYMISRPVSGFSTGEVAKASVYREANEWCIKRGLVLVPVSSTSRNLKGGRPIESAELTFRALSPGDPAIAQSDNESADHLQRVQIR